MLKTLRSRASSLTTTSNITRQSLSNSEKPVVAPSKPAQPRIPAGVYVLYPPEKIAQKNVDTDIVAIHGLGGHAHATWTHDSGHLWLRDSLPPHVPGARILTFSYDSEAAWSDPSSGIEIAALQLLKYLRGVRQNADEQARRIVFICHSLGGVVLKKALSCMRTLKQYEAMQSKVVGVLFMGTPHRDSSTAPIGKVLRNAVNCARVDSEARLELIAKLKEAERSFMEITQASLPYLEPPLRIVSVYEQEELQPWERLIVEPFSAMLGTPNERILPTAANHRTMVKFSPAEEARYLPIRTALIELITGIKTTVPEEPSNNPQNPTSPTRTFTVLNLQTSPTSPTSPTQSSPPLSLSRVQSTTSTRSHPTIRSSATDTTYGPPAPSTILSAESRGMPVTNRSMAQLIETRIRNHAASRPESGVRAHGAAYHAKRAHRDRMERAERERWEFGRGLEGGGWASGGGVEAWREGIESGDEEGEVVGK